MLCLPELGMLVRCWTAAPVSVFAGTTAWASNALAEAPDAVVMVGVEVALRLEIAVVANIIMASALCAGTSKTLTAPL